MPVNDIFALAEEYQEKTLSTGIAVKFTTFPLKMYQKIMSQAEEKYPIPKPPKKKIKTFGGEEMVDNPDEPKYAAKVKAIKADKEKYVGEHVGEIALELCIQVDLSLHEPLIARLEKYSGETFPEDPYERKAKFLSDYALGSLGDWEIATAVPLAMMGIHDGEVAKRIDSFRSDVERNGSNGTEAPGLETVVGLEVQPALEGDQGG